MKKALLTLLLAAAAVLPVAAQDTLTLPITPSPTYWPENTRWMQDNPSASHLSVTKYTQDITIYEAFGYRLKSPLRIVGLAGIRDTLALDHHPSGPENMAARVPEYFLLFQPRPDTLELLKRVCYTDVEPRCKIKLHAQIYGRPGKIFWQYPNLYEVYFDDTVTVQDSFYIGCTYYNGIPPQAGAIRPVKTGGYCMASNGFYESDSLRWISLDDDSTFWPSYMLRLSPGIFPIIDTTGMIAPDTTQGGDTTIVDTTSISPVADRFTHLMPNPATDQATVYSSFPMRSVAIYDPTGRRVLHRRVDDRTLQLDLTGYAKGTYLVVILTPAGRSVKRLVVQ